MEQFWNERYNNEDNIYGTEPNAFFKQELDKLTPGKLLLPGDGEARNAIYAANQGWEVAAFDSSEVAVRKGLENAEKVGVSIEYNKADTESFNTNNNSFDVIALVYFHLLPEQRKPFHEKITQWLKPGGTLIVEGFNPKQLGNPSGGPKNIEMLYSPEMMRKDFAALSIQMIDTPTEILNEGSYHKGEAKLIRMVAKKA